MSRYHTARRLISAGDPMFSCPACGWEGTESELMEWGSDGECPRCEGELERERPTSGLATIGEVRRAMADIAGEEADTGDPAVGDVLLNRPGEMAGGPEWRRVDDLFGRMPDFIEIWRAVGLRKGDALDEDSLGTSWTWDRKSAEAYNRPSSAESIVVMHGEVAKDDVDWPTTFALNILLPTEREIRLPLGADVELLDVDGRPAGRYVNASRPGRASGGRPAPGPPPRLYHGTPGRNAPAIAAEGIAPGRTPNFGGLSSPDSVYLTESRSAAAEWVYNAYVDGTAEPDGDGSATVSVFEVDAAKLDPRLLAPDAGGNPGDWRYSAAVPPSSARLVSEEDYTDDVGRECEGCGRHPWNCACEFGEGR